MPRHSRILHLPAELLRWCVVCLGLIGTPSGTAAQDRPSVEVEWSAPPDCPDRAALLRILEARLHGRPSPIALQARAKILRHGTRYRLILELDSPSGRASRALTDSRCESLADAAAVLIALALESEATSALPEPKPQDAQDAQDAQDPQAAPEALETTENSEESASAPPSTVQRPQEVAPGEPPPSSNGDLEEAEDGAVEITHDPEGGAQPRHLQLQLSAALKADLGSFPHQPALGVQAQLAARWRPLYVALGATYWPARDQRSDSYTNARLRGSGLFADVSLGVDLSAAPVLLTPALALELGQQVAEAVGIAGPERSRVLWLALGPSLSCALRIQKNWEIALDLAGLVPAYRNHWRVRTPQGDVPAFDAAPIVVRAALRVGYVLR